MGSNPTATAMTRHDARPPPPRGAGQRLVRPGSVHVTDPSDRWTAGDPGLPVVLRHRCPRIRTGPIGTAGS